MFWKWKASSIINFGLIVVQLSSQAGCDHPSALNIESEIIRLTNRILLPVLLQASVGTCVHSRYQSVYQQASGYVDGGAGLDGVGSDRFGKLAGGSCTAVRCT